MNANLAAGSLATNTLISDGWAADDLRCRLLGQALGTAGSCGTSDISAVNAHFTHYAALSAAGFTSANFDDVLKSKDVAAAGGATPSLLGKIVFSMGCHAGLSVPNRASLGGDAGLNIDPSLDFAEAMALQRAVYIASTGFGLGDDEGIGGTERLMTLYAQDLVKGDVAAGAALVSAKQRYVGGLASMTVYDEKSTIQTVFYGLPMYRVHTPAVAPALRANTAGVAATTTTLTMKDGATTTTTAAQVNEVDAATGTYFTAAGDAQSTAGRPIEPRMVAPLAPSASSPVHGVIITGGAYTDTTGFDPVIVRPTNEWEAAVREPSTCLSSFWPSELGGINTLEVRGALQRTLVVTPGQFRCTSGGAATVTGLQRLYQSISAEVLRCTSADSVPPTIASVRLRDSGGVVLSVTANDSSGIARIIVLRLLNGVMTPFTVNPGGATSARSRSTSAGSRTAKT